MYFILAALRLSRVWKRAGPCVSLGTWRRTFDVSSVEYPPWKLKHLQLYNHRSLVQSIIEPTHLAGYYRKQTPKRKKTPAMNLK
jgi:hypothetical protein